jgi:hypothetical protein
MGRPKKIIQTNNLEQFSENPAEDVAQGMLTYSEAEKLGLLEGQEVSKDVEIIIENKESLPPAPPKPKPFPRRPEGETIEIAPAIAETIVVKPKDTVVDFKEDLIIKKKKIPVQTQVNAQNAPRTSVNYARRGVQLINDINRVLESEQNFNSTENGGAFVLNKNKPVNNVGKGTYKR